MSDKLSTPADNLTIDRGMGLEAAVMEFEKWFVFWALDRNDFNQCKTAAELKTHRNNLVRRIHEWGWTQKVYDGYHGKKVTRCP